MIDPELRDLYQEVILDHGKHPRHFGVMADASHEADGHNPLCGDKVHVYLKLDTDSKIEDVMFDGRGCAISIASASMMTELLNGKSVEAGKALMDAFVAMVKGESADGPAVNDDDLDNLQMLSGVSEFPMRVKCATLAWHTFAAAADGGAKTTTE
jgi:nitrogen fixation NifU-like protein